MFVGPGFYHLPLAPAARMAPSGRLARSRLAVGAHVMMDAMAKREPRFPDGHKTIICCRCNAPANNAKRGGRLVPVTGFRTGVQGSARRRGGHKIRLYQHADTEFCAKRLPHATLNVPHLLRPRR